MARFEEARPGILGALLTAVSTALARIDSVRLERLPRMADFARWIVAAEPALPWKAGEFLQAYSDNREAAYELALEASPIGEPIRQFALAQGTWTGKASELHQQLETSVEDQVRMRPGWPKRSNTFSGMLRRLVTDLRAVGVVVEFHAHGRQGRFITITTIPQKIVTTVTDRHIPDAGVANGDACDDPHARCDDPVTIRGDAEMPVVSQRDDGDDQMHHHSGVVDASCVVGQREQAKREVADL
jgi:hypothetical protein